MYNIRLLLIVQLVLFQSFSTTAEALPITNGPITIVTSDNVNLGYKAYVQNLADLFSHSFKDRKIRVIFEGSGGSVGHERPIENKDLFQFSNNVEVLWLSSYYHNHHHGYLWEDDFKKAQQWIDESSTVIIGVFWVAGNIQIPRSKCIDVSVIESPVRPCKCKYSVKLGLGKDRDGILVAPHVLNKARKSKDMRGFSADFKAALDQHPKLGDILNQSKRSDGKPHYYMAYKHTEDSYGEFVALAGYMEEDEQDL